MTKKKVMIVDDSKLIRRLLSEIINAAPDLEVVGEASDPLDARDKIKQLNPDVLTLDIEMPKMDGITFLKNIMRLRPMPVVMISTLTTKGSQFAIEAIELGAIDCIAKPAKSEMGVANFGVEVLGKIRAALRANMALIEKTSRQLNEDDATNKIIRPKGYTFNQNSLILIGASTGGIDAFTKVLNQFPEQCPPVVIVQHIPPIFSTSLANRLDSSLPFSVKEADDGMLIEPNSVYIARGGIHLAIKQRGEDIYCALEDSELVDSHKPSVNVMFSSATQLKDKKISAALLTGMGSDGATGLLKLKVAGYHTVVQDQDSSVVWGMPKVAYELNAHTDVQPLDKIAHSLLSAVGKFQH